MGKQKLKQEKMEISKQGKGQNLYGVERQNLKQEKGKN